MAKTNVTLSINVQGEDTNSSSTTIQTDSLAELYRLLSLAGLSSEPVENNPAGELPKQMSADSMGQPVETLPVESVVDEDTDGGEYKPSADLKVRSPNQRMTNARFADNPLEEDLADGEFQELDIEPEMDFNNVDPMMIADTYHDFLKFVDHDEAVARTAEEYGVNGDVVEKAVDKNNAYEGVSENFDDYNQVDDREEAPPAPASKNLKDYLSDLGAEREVKHAAKGFKVKIEWMDSKYDSRFEELTIDAGTPKEAEQQAIAQAKAQAEANGESFSFIDAETEIAETIDEARSTSTMPSKRVRKAVEKAIALRWIEAKNADALIQAIYSDYEDGGIASITMDDVAEIIDSSGIGSFDGEVDEAYGYRKNKWDQQSIDRSYKHQAALLPVPGMYSLDTLGTHEYYGKDLEAGQGSYVVMKIDTGDADKPRYTFCASAGDSSDWKAGDSVLTYHDQSGKERPAVVVTNFSGKEWVDPAGRKAIAQRLAQGGMDPRKKYSVRTFK